MLSAAKSKPATNARFLICTVAQLTHLAHSLWCHCFAGIETVRRDNCLLVRQVVETCLHKVLLERNVQVRA